MIQFLRSFLFLSIASVVAVESKINQIYLFENGPVALNPMFSEGRVNTRTAHPRFLELFQKLIRALFKVKLEIQNPFLYETKGEVVSRLAQPEFRGLVRKTCSCWNWFSVPIRADRIGRGAFKGPHDGDCLPCVIRRASVEQAKLAGSDVSYLMDVFDEFSRLDVPHQVLIADYLRFCRNVEMLEGDSLLLEHPDFSICAQNVEARGLIAMYQRHAREMIRSFCEKGSPETVHMLIPAEGVQGADPCDSIKVHGEHYIK
jgi:hypothetical protein